MIRLIVTFFLFATQLFAENYYFQKIEVVGNKRIKEEKILSALELSSGSMTGDQVTAAIKRVYKLGGVKNVIARKSGSTLQIEVLEQPSVRKIFIKGNETASLEDLANVITLKDRRYVEPAYFQQIVNNTEFYYETLGHLDAEVEYETEEVTADQVDLTFNIDEGRKFKINEVQVVFDSEPEDFDSDDIVSELQTRSYKWWNSWMFGTGRVNQAYLAGDRSLIQQFLLDHGYINSQVSEAEIEREEDELNVVFYVETGPQFFLGKYTASGDLVNDSLQETIAVLDLEEGEVFNASKVRAEALRLGDVYGDQGYAFANVVPETDIHFEDRRVDLNFQVSKGKPVHVREIKISGNNKTYDNVIRREMKVQEQELFSRVDVKRSEAKLRRLGYFEQVEVAPESIAGVDDKIDLNVQVKEQSTGEFSIGGGFSSSDGALFNTRLSENNFLGTGRRVRFNMDIGQRADNLVVGMDDRRFLDTNWATGIELLKRERIFSDFDRNLTGGNVSVGYPLEEFFGEWSNDVDISLKYQYLNIKIDDVDPNDAAQLVIDSEGTSTVSGFIPQIQRNTINNPLVPTEGSRQTLLFELMGVGGSEKYYLAELRNELFIPLFDVVENSPLVFSWRFNFGYGETTDDDPFPLFRRYFPGGINSVRGFRNRRMGPVDENGNEFGGSKQLINNLELIFPLVSSAGLRGLIFYDIGQAFDDDVSISYGGLRDAVGFGFRWNSPMGPLRLEFGHPLDRKEDESSVVTLFSFGGPLY